MTYRRWTAAVLIAVAVFIASCGGVTDPSPETTATPAATGTAEPSPTVPPATATPLLATATPTAIPPTSTPAPIATPRPPRVVAEGWVNRIAFAATDGAVYTINPDGSDRRRVSPEFTAADGDAGPRHTWPVWSPDGGSLVFSSMTPVLGNSIDIALMRGDALGAHAPVIIFADDPQSNGVGSSTPHYAAWSPDGGSIVLITGTGQGLVTVVIDSDYGNNVRRMAEGQPVYMDWSRDSQYLLVHLDAILLLNTFAPDGSRSGLSPVGRGSISYHSPQWSPAGNRYLYTDVTDGVTHLKIGKPGEEATVIRDIVGPAAFSWSPDGSRFAVVTGDGGQYFESLSILSGDGAGETVLIEKQLLGFWWSPDGTRLALAAPHEQVRDAIAWTVIDVDTGTETHLAVNVPTEEFMFMQFFFDQYVVSHQLWSPDSTRLVLSGALIEPAGLGQDGMVDPPDGLRAGIWVVDASGEQPPVQLGEGRIAAWSPK